jgi:zinc transporter 1/2/3
MSNANASVFANSSDIAYFTYSPICGGGNDFDGRLGLHIAAVFVILATSMFGALSTCSILTLGALFPMSAKKLPALHIPDICFTFAKFFGSGVIIATAFIHLLASSFQELGDPCLSTFWYVNYPWSAAFSMISVFSLFLVELFAMRFAHMSFATTDALGRADSVEPILPDSTPPVDSTAAILPDHFSPDANHAHETKPHESPVATLAIAAPKERLDARLLGFFILEFGVIFHSVIIGLTLSTTGADFNTLFVVIIFHQMFEGLGLGSRLAILPFKRRSIWPWVLGIVYGFVTPLGMAIGLGLRTAYDSASQTALIVSGTLDAISSGILLYTGLVELLAHEFLFSRGIKC